MCCCQICSSVSESSGKRNKHQNCNIYCIEQPANVNHDYLNLVKYPNPIIKKNSNLNSASKSDYVTSHVDVKYIHYAQMLPYDIDWNEASIFLNTYIH